MKPKRANKQWRMTKRKCIVCGKIFWSWHNAKICSAECRLQRKKIYNTKVYKVCKRKQELKHANMGGSSRIMVKYRLRKHDEALVASGYAPKVEVRVAYNTSGRRMRYENRGHIPGGAV